MNGQSAKDTSKQGTKEENQCDNFKNQSGHHGEKKSGLFWTFLNLMYVYYLDF